VLRHPQPEIVGRAQRQGQVSADPVVDQEQRFVKPPGEERAQALAE
jgi:hypothetical protein